MCSPPAAPAAGPSTTTAPQIVDADIQPDTSQGESDYDTAEDYTTDTTTLATSVKEFRYEHGRRYHSYDSANYWAPNDETQNEQLDIFHHVYSLVLDGELYRAPISEKPQNILDLGTGTGIWAIDVADKFPSAVVIGNDISPIQPVWVPPNCKFEVDNITSPWTYPREHFDFIHMRALYGSIRDWPPLLSTIKDHLAPGGWFESVETTTTILSDDNSLPKDSKLVKWGALAQDIGIKIGQEFEIAPKIAGWMREAGFVNVREEVYKVPINSWPKDKKYKQIGAYNLLNMLQAAEGFTISLFTNVLGWSVEEVTTFLNVVKEEMKNRKYHSYFHMHVCYGQRPEE